MRVVQGSATIRVPLILATALFCLAAPPAHGAAATIEPARVPAAGRQTALLRITEPGRYALSVASGAGTGLQLTDQMAGPGPVSGAAGERDGRVDLLLDRGTYRLVTHGAQRAAGEARLEARPFRELSAPQPPLLVEGRPLQATLGDLEQRSWWLQVDEPRRVLLEVAGRNLSDLRLFGEGGWLLDVTPVQHTVEPEPGRPLRSCRIAARLERGLYLLTAFGGPDEPWPAGGAEHPLHLRSGLPQLGEAGRTRYRVGPFGSDSYLVPASVTFVQLELPEAGAARLQESPFSEAGDPFEARPREAELTKKHREPVVSLSIPAQGQPHLITVRAPAGQPYVLQHFVERDSYEFRASGRYWIGTVHSGHPQDNADATALVTVSPRPARGVEPLLSQVVAIDGARGWARRCNLLEPLTVFFRVGETGTYEVLSRGTKARFRFEPFLISRPADYREPPLQGGGSTWELEAGWHVLTAVPDEPGIMEAAVRPVGKLDAVWDLLKPDRAMRGEPVRPAVTFPAAALDWDHTYTVWLNRRPGVRSGIVLRQLPVDLAQPLPLALAPGGEVPVAARAGEPGTIRAESEAGEALEIRAGTGPWVKSLEAAPGTLELRVRNAGAQSVIAALRLEPRRLRADAPLPTLPTLPASALAPLPEFPELDAAAPRFLDLASGGSATFAVRAAEPAFHTLESTGLLDTAGTLRSRFIPSLAQAGAGGSGRNFLIGAFLRDGLYQLTVAAQGPSRGHLGLRLRRAPLRDGGALRDGAPARVTVAAAEGVLHGFEIVEAGIYRVSAFAAGRPLACRLEDAEGWPLERPGLSTPFERRFEPGRYRLLLPPGAVGARRVTLLERLVEPPRLSGHGPHALALGRTVEHVWEEPAAGAERVPDRWEFSLPAAAGLSVRLTGEMQGEIRRSGDGPGAEPLALVQPGRGWSVKLAAGDYTLAAVCSRRNNQAPYEIALWPVELLAGGARDVEAPATLEVAVGAEGLYEFASAGARDVRVRLLAADGAPVAEQEDRPDDWNVQLAARLAPGAYRLEVTPSGAAAATTRVAMRAIPEHVEPPLALPATREVLPGEAVVTVPLGVPAAERVLVVRASAAETIGLALDLKAPGGWETVRSEVGSSATILLPIAPGQGARASGYRVRLWSLDRRGGAVALSAVAAAPTALAERELLRGVDVALAAGTGPAAPLALAEVALARPGLLRLAGPASWRAAGAPDRPLLAPDEGLAASAGARLWLAAEAAPGAREVLLRGERVVLTPDAPLSVALPQDGSPLVCDVDPRGRGPMMVTAQTAAGRPGVALLPLDSPARPSGSVGPTVATARAMAVVGERAASALLPAETPAAALLWGADARSPASRATLRLSSFVGGAEEALPAGVAGGRLDSLAARRFALPAGDKRVRLTLGAGLAAALVRGGAVESAHDAGPGVLDETIETDAATLLLLNAGATAAPWAAEVLPIGARGPALAPGRPLISRFAAAGTLRVPVAAEREDAAPRRLRSRGAEAALFLGDDGRALVGDDLEIRGGGRLLLRHGAGVAAAWVERPGDQVPGLWGGAPPRRERALKPPESVPLEGSALSLVAKTDRPAVLHLRAEEALVGAIVRPAGPAEAFLHPGGAALDLLLAPGATAVWLRPPFGGELRGAAEALLSPLTAIGEGPGPETLLAPGAARYFTFSVEREGPLGIGLRASPDTATCALLDAAGRTLGTGVVQLPRLAPGAYLLAVRAPAGGGPVSVRPALAGLAPPQEGPPEEVIRRYLDLSRGEAERAAAPGPADGGETQNGAEGD